MLANEVLLRRLIEEGDPADSLVERHHQHGKRVSEEAADTQRDIDPRTAELRQRHDLEANSAMCLGIPDGTHADQSEYLRNLIPARPQGGCAPDTHRDAFRPALHVLEVAREHLVRQILTHRPCSPRGEPTRIEGIEVAACRQNVRHSATRRTCGSRRDMLTCQSLQEIARLVRRSRDVGHEGLAGESQRSQEFLGTGKQSVDAIRGEAQPRQLAQQAAGELIEG